MAHVTGTATNHFDLLARLRDFLVGNADLVAAGQQWEVIAGKATGAFVNGDYVSFRGKGLSATDDILCSIRVTSTPASNIHNWQLYGHTSYSLANPGVLQAGNPPNVPAMLLSSSAITYWFIANGRHFKVITRINGRYDAIYLGLILPDHTPNDWPYPMFVGGSGLNATLLASDDTSNHTNFYDPSAENSASVIGTAYLLVPGGNWRAVRNRWTNTSSIDGGVISMPWNAYYFPNATRRAIDGSAWLHRSMLCQIGDGAGVNTGGVVTGQAPDGGVWYGSFDGVFFVPAFGSSAEEIATQDGVDHILIPNIARTGNRNFAAIALD
ncbi:hypothetical protein XccvBFoX4_gp29 [Xanthomonas phage FoX4]|uniref:Virion structural protein n=1 Tax=Xanthomonas phage FoX4 TaxID=2723900 RepID=A0A858WML6_9CAUD|nr:hypothetical protein KNU97_gp29 [Xanthomonas phage FoX4]QJI52983.1 hypothetical protein XccvBFoX4_gp29 [Xanthomonas phage FoX4]